ncbi:MAG: cytochrome b [Limnobacter sp.]|nr:cytochrome b [Limnobacter sp.]
MNTNVHAHAGAPAFVEKSRDRQQRYDGLTRFFHWSMAILVGWQMLKFFDRINDGEHWVGENLASWHLPIGTVILLVVALRLFWAARRENPPSTLAPIASVLAKIGHLLLYAGMVMLPVTGILYMIGNGYGFAFLGVQLVAEGPEIPWMIAVGSLHSPIAWLLLVMVIGHVGMALVHHYVRKDGVLRRML